MLYSETMRELGNSQNACSVGYIPRLIVSFEMVIPMGIRVVLTCPSLTSKVKAF